MFVVSGKILEVIGEGRAVETVDLGVVVIVFYAESAWMCDGVTDREPGTFSVPVETRPQIIEQQINRSGLAAFSDDIFLRFSC